MEQEENPDTPQPILNDNWKSFVDFPLPREIGSRFLTELILRNKITDSSFQHISPNLEIISLEGCTKVSAQAIKSIASETVTTFNLSHCSFITDDVISSVTKNCPNIKSLVLNNCQGLTEESIRLISVNLPCIQNIQLGKFPKKWPAFPFLIEMKQLQSISLSEWNTLNNGNLESLGTLPCLQSLDLTNCRRITEQGMIKLIEGNPLRFTNLILSGCLKIADISFLSHCVNLYSITFASSPFINDLSLQGLTDNCTKLRSITLSYCDNITNELYYSQPLKSNASLITLKGIKYVLENGDNLLTISFLFLRQVTNESVQYLANCKKLIKVRWEGEKVDLTDSVLSTISTKVNKFEEIYFQNFSTVTDIVFKDFINHSPNLSVIYITTCPKFGDESLAALGKCCPNLKTLIVDSSNRNITDVGLIALSEGCPKLEVVSIFNGNWPIEYTNDKITNNGIKSIARKCPLLQSISLRYIDVLDDCLELFHSLTEITIKACKLLTVNGMNNLITSNQYLQMINLSEMKQFTETDIELWESKNLIVYNHS